jgi:hypothetical protein
MSSPRRAIHFTIAKMWVAEKEVIESNCLTASQWGPTEVALRASDCSRRHGLVPMNQHGVRLSWAIQRSFPVPLQTRRHKTEDECRDRSGGTLGAQGSPQTCATYYDEHLPESSIEILGHSVGGITYRHYAHRAPLAFKSVQGDHDHRAADRVLGAAERARGRVSVLPAGVR